MPRGGPDFGAVAPRALTVPVTDLGEVAVRLGSPAAFDRQGTVLGIVQGDAMPGSLDRTFGSGRIDVLAGQGLSGGYAWRLSCPAVGDHAGMFLGVPYIGNTPSGCEAVFQPGSGVGWLLRVQVRSRSEGIATQGMIALDSAISKVRYITTTGSLVDTPIQPAFFPSFPGWYSIKVVVDPLNDIYVRALLNGEDLGLAGVAARTFGPTSLALEAMVELEATAAAANEGWVHTLLATVNEGPLQ